MYEDKDVDDLVKASHQLMTVSLLAADVLSEQFDDLVRPSAEAVHAILQKFPSPKDWDGELRDEQIEEKLMPRFNPETGNNENIGVELRHTPTGIVRQSMSRYSVEQNRETARKSLAEAVAKRFAATT